jgi:poly(3-hydroxybutyrate) depolymerase
MKTKENIKMGELAFARNLISAPAAILIMFVALVLLTPCFVAYTKAAELPTGASFELIADIGFKGSHFYLYSPSKPYSDFLMSSMLNSVIFVYPDKPYGSKEHAWNNMVSTGLIEIAEKGAAYLIAPMPVNGDKWSEGDLKVYYESQFYLAGGAITPPPQQGGLPATQYPRNTYNNQQYIIAEGNGATFVNNILSQHAERIAGMLSFGGKIDKSVKEKLPLPAYLVNADKSAVDYYKKVNKTDKETSPGVYENSSYKLKKVITVSGGDVFNKRIIADAWKQIFSRTARVCITANLVLNNKDMSEWFLQDRPNYEELGIKRIDHRKEKLPDGTIAIWYDYVPNIVPANPKTKVPLVIDLHGAGGDPIYQSDSNGWTEKAAKEGFVTISPDYPGPTEEGEKIILGILDYARKTYPIDEGRVYLTGFSMGGMSTGMVGLKCADRFAAIAVMGASGADDESVRAAVRSEKSKIDLPFAVIKGSEDGFKDKIPTDKERFLGGLERMMEINESNYGNPDFTAHPYWGYPTYNPEVQTSLGLKYDVSYIYKDAGHKSPIAKLVILETAGHAHSQYFATLAWDFFTKFKRPSAR